MNANTWFYSQSFNGRIDRSTHPTHEQLTTKQMCPICHKEVNLLVHTWAKADDKIAHDYCLRTGGK